MTPAIISEQLRNKISQADLGRCAYCQTSETTSGIPLTIDHIQPVSKGGETIFSNLCLACRPCNEFKASTTEVEDPLTGEFVKLFHPRSQEWHLHFRWSADGTRVEGITATGRATVMALKMNREAIVAARSRWVWGGWHPPQE